MRAPLAIIKMMWIYVVNKPDRRCLKIGQPVAINNYITSIMAIGRPMVFAHSPVINPADGELAMCLNGLEELAPSTGTWKGLGLKLWGQQLAMGQY